MEQKSSGSQRPSKGILKHSTSMDSATQDGHPKGAHMHFDEMNILATHHPADKDYGHMKIDEPKTPYERTGNDDDEDRLLNPDELEDRLQASTSTGGKPRRTSFDNSEDSDEREYANLTPEEIKKRKEFKRKRKLHYNEFQVMRRARELMQQEEEEEEKMDQK